MTRLANLLDRLADPHFERGPDGHPRFVGGPPWAPRVYELATEQRAAALRSLHRRFHALVIAGGGALGAIAALVGWSAWLLALPYALLFGWYRLRLRALTRDLPSTRRPAREQMAVAARAMPSGRLALLLAASLATLATALWLDAQGAERGLVAAGAALGGLGAAASLLLLRLRRR